MFKLCKIYFHVLHWIPALCSETVKSQGSRQLSLENILQKYFIEEIPSNTDKID